MKRATIANLRDSSTVDEQTGAVRSVQSADLSLPEAALTELWSPTNLERLARTYWRFLARVTLGLVRVKYTDGERFVVLLFKPLKLLTFKAPEYELGADRGVVRWRVERGLLVARAGRQGSGYLQIEVTRLTAAEEPPPARARVNVAVEVKNFYPWIAAGLGRWIYNQTQSRIHVIVTKGFLRSLARLDLAESRIGRYRIAEQTTIVEQPTVAAPSPAPAGLPPGTALPANAALPAKAALPAQEALPAKAPRSGPPRRRAAWRGRGGR